MIAVPAQLVADTFAIFRDCGGGRRECVAYWLGPADTPEKVDEVIHPKHTSMGGEYQIDDQWLTTFWFALEVRVPLGGSITTGLVPFASFGRLSCSRF